MVERRPADDGLLPQPDRHPDGDDRQSDAGPVDSVHAEPASPTRSSWSSPITPQQVGTSGSRSTTRSRPTARCSTSRRATARRTCLPHLPDGRRQHQVGQRRPLDDHAAQARADSGGVAGARRLRGEPAGGAAVAAAAVAAAAVAAATRRRWHAPTRRPRNIAIRAASSCRPSTTDFGTSVRFVNTLMKSGVAIHRATAAFTVGGKQYPAGSLVVKTGAGVPSARDGHVRAAGSPGRHPVSGRAADAPYDVAGWTLAMQMGVQFDRILDGFDGPFEKLTDFAKPPAGSIRGAQQRRRLLLQPQVERQLHRDQPAARGQRRRHVARGTARWATARSTWRQADDARDPAEGGDGSRRELRGRGDGADRAVREAAQAAHRPVRHVRRRHAGGLDAAAARELRVPVRGRLSADARRRQPAREVRRAHLQRRRADARRWRRAGRRWRRAVAMRRRR